MVKEGEGAEVVFRPAKRKRRKEPLGSKGFRLRGFQLVLELKCASASLREK